MTNPDFCALFYVEAYDPKTNRRIGSDPWEYTAGAYDYDEALEKAAKLWQTLTDLNYTDFLISIQGWDDDHIYGEYDTAKPALDEYLRLDEEDQLRNPSDYSDSYEPEGPEDPEDEDLDYKMVLARSITNSPAWDGADADWLVENYTLEELKDLRNCGDFAAEEYFEDRR